MREQSSGLRRLFSLPANRSSAFRIDLEDGVAVAKPPGVVPCIGAKTGKLEGGDAGGRHHVELCIASLAAGVDADAEQNRWSGGAGLHRGPPAVERLLVPGTVVLGSRHRRGIRHALRRGGRTRRRERREPGDGRDDKRGHDTGSRRRRLGRPTAPGGGAVPEGPRARAGQLRPLPGPRRARAPVPALAPDAVPAPAPARRRTSRTSSITRSRDSFQSSRTIPNARRTAAQSRTPFAGRPALAG